MYMKILRDLMAERVAAIDAGNSRISEERQLALIDAFTRVSNPNEKMSQYQALSYLKEHGVKMCKSTFNNYIKAGKLPHSRHDAGFKENF